MVDHGYKGKDGATMGCRHGLLWKIICTPAVGRKNKQKNCIKVRGLARRIQKQIE